MTLTPSKAEIKNAKIRTRPNGALYVHCLLSVLMVTSHVSQESSDCNRSEQTAARVRMRAGRRRYLGSVIVAFIINLCLIVHGTENVLYCRENWIFRECKFDALVLVLITVIYCRSSYRWIRESEVDLLQITLSSRIHRSELWIPCDQELRLCLQILDSQCD